LVQDAPLSGKSLSAHADGSPCCPASAAPQPTASR